jgi:hypothetical protein
MEEAYQLISKVIVLPLGFAILVFLESLYEIWAAFGDKYLAARGRRFMYWSLTAIAIMLGIWGFLAFFS